MTAAFVANKRFRLAKTHLLPRDLPMVLVTKVTYLQSAENANQAKTIWSRKPNPHANERGSTPSIKIMHVCMYVVRPTLPNNKALGCLLLFVSASDASVCWAASRQPGLEPPLPLIIAAN